MNEEINQSDIKPINKFKSALYLYDAELFDEALEIIERNDLINSEVKRDAKLLKGLCILYKDNKYESKLFDFKTKSDYFDIEEVKNRVGSYCDCHFIKVNFNYNTVPDLFAMSSNPTVVVHDSLSFNVNSKGDAMQQARKAVLNNLSNAKEFLIKFETYEGLTNEDLIIIQGLNIKLAINNKDFDFGVKSIYKLIDLLKRNDDFGQDSCSIMIEFLSKLKQAGTSLDNPDILKLIESIKEILKDPIHKASLFLEINSNRHLNDYTELYNLALEHKAILEVNNIKNSIYDSICNYIKYLENKRD